jgi:hypothetical protein
LVISGVTVGLVDDVGLRVSRMNAFDFSRLPRILLTLGVVTVAGLWIAEEAGWLKIATPMDALPTDPRVSEPLPVRVTLQGVIAGDQNTPGIAILAEAGKRPLLVPEGAPFNDDLHVERVMPDRVVLRQRSSGAPIVLALSLMPDDIPVSPGWKKGTSATHSGGMIRRRRVPVGRCPAQPTSRPAAEPAARGNRPHRLSREGPARYLPRCLAQAVLAPHNWPSFSRANPCPHPMRT